MTDLLKSARGALWRLFLARPSFRRRLGYHLKAEYPEDLDARIPLGCDLASPLFDPEFGSSFSEIFLEQEYAAMFANTPLPRRWIDLGCYAGFFSLWLEWKRRRAGATEPSEALLVDANTTVAPWIKRLLAVNGLVACWKHRCAAIAPGTGSVEFVERSYMGSSLRTIDDQPGATVSVPILTETALFELLPPPYDLIKADMEGAEYELLLHYPELLRRTRRLSLEWHSWHAGGGGLAQLRELLRAAGFAEVLEVQPARTLSGGRQTGVLLLENTRPV